MNSFLYSGYLLRDLLLHSSSHLPGLHFNITTTVDSNPFSYHPFSYHSFQHLSVGMADCWIRYLLHNAPSFLTRIGHRVTRVCCVHVPWAVRIFKKRKSHVEQNILRMAMDICISSPLNHQLFTRLPSLPFSNVSSYIFSNLSSPDLTVSAVPSNRVLL